MTLLNATIRSLLECPFESLPDPHRARAYGVDYARLALGAGGELFLTRYGWSLSSMVVPQAWFVDNRYSKSGRRLPGSTGTVYRVPAMVPVGATDSLVVKFSRVAQDVPLFVDKPVAELVPRAAVESATFNDPFEEFGLLMELRRGPFGPGRPRIRTKRPLAIYSPPGRYELWQLGRKQWLFEQHCQRLAEDQARNASGTPVTLDLHRDYIVVFQWVKGSDAEILATEGLLSDADLNGLYMRVSRELAANGFVMLDNKPRHYILRRPAGAMAPIKRSGELVYALIDFELLKRACEYKAGA